MTKRQSENNSFEKQDDNFKLGIKPIDSATPVSAEKKVESEEKVDGKHYTKDFTAYQTDDFDFDYGEQTEDDFMRKLEKEIQTEESLKFEKDSFRIDELTKADSSPIEFEEKQNNSYTPNSSSHKFKPENSSSLNQADENYPLKSDQKSYIHTLDKPEKRGFFGSIGNFLSKNRKLIFSLIFAGFVLGSIGAAIVAMWLAARYNSIGNIVAKAVEIREGSTVYDRNDKVLFRFDSSSEKREIVNIDKIPDEMRGAIIALEDENFYDNAVGIPWRNMAGATTKCLVSRGNNCRGGSGLSQQLIKNVTGDDQKSYGRKVNELLSAIKFNQEVGKNEKEKQDKVLELYLNWVPFGRNTYGVQAASKSFYGKEINKNLTIPEACYLASMVQRPSTYSEAIRIELTNRKNPKKPIQNPWWDTLQARKNACIEKMFTKDIKNRGTDRFIKSEQEMIKLQQQIVNFQPYKADNQSYPHLRNYLVNELRDKMDIQEADLTTQGYKIYTSFDKQIQDKADEIVRSSASNRIIANGGDNAAALILDGPTGGIVAMVGSRDFNNEDIGGQVNITTAPRQPGSSYKPYVYASAFENGFNPATILLDASTNFGGYTPRNFSRTNYGLVSMRRALQDSLNVPAVKAAYLSQGGGNSPNATTAVSGITGFAEKIGVKHPYKKNCTISTALGGCEVTMVSHITGINTLLQEGNLRTATPFRKILTKTNLDIYADKQAKDNPYPTRDRVIDPRIAREIADVMSDYEARSSGIWGQGRFNLQLEGWEGANRVAAKTGTTSDVKDTWTVGGSPYYSVTVWVGNTDGRPMNRDATSSGTAAPIWNDIMKEIHRNKTKKGFSKEGLQRVNIDPQTGLLGSGRSELMTKEQADQLGQAQANLANQDFDAMGKSIFQNRTAVIQRKVVINKVDKKLVPEELLAITSNQSAATDSSLQSNPSQLPKELFEEVQCKEVISEFPQNASWFNPAKAFQQAASSQFSPCPTEKSKLEVKNVTPIITSNLVENQLSPVPIIISAKARATDAKIADISITIDGQKILSEKNTNTLSLDPIAQNLTGTKDVTIKVTDTYGLSTETVFKAIVFDGVTASSSSESSSESSQSSLSQSSSSSMSP